MKRLMIALLMMVLIMCISSCGGGGGTDSGSLPISPVVVVNTPLYGFYASADNPNDLTLPLDPTIKTSVEETANFVNVVMVGHWKGETEIISDSQKSVELGVTKLIVPVLNYYNPNTSRFEGVLNLLNDMRNLGLLQYVVAVYPIDEPNVNNPAGDFGAALDDLRAQLDTMDDTKNIKLFSIYGPVRFGFANIQKYDWVGYDDYDLRDTVFATIDSTVRPLLKPGAKIVLVPGGFTPYQQDPASFYTYAQTHADVALIMPFIWIDVKANDISGIRSNPTRQIYINLGCAIVGKPSACAS